VDVDVQGGDEGEGEEEEEEGGDPESREREETRIECSKRSWPDIKAAECRSPVQRVISTQSSAWFRRSRRDSSAGRAGVREMCMWGRVLRRRCRVWYIHISYINNTTWFNV